jgi:RNA polymerase sporulation-specific sigma factor
MNLRRCVSRGSLNEFVYFSRFIRLWKHKHAKEEERELSYKSQCKGRQPRQQNIFTSFRVHIVKKFDNTGEDLEDLISIGTIGLIKAIESFSPNKGTKLATFAARCIENEILMHLRSLKKTRKDVSLHDPIGTDKEGNEITLIDILGTEADDVVDKVQLKIEKSKIYKNLDILDDREKEVVMGRFGLEHGGEERTQREIVKELG